MLFILTGDVQIGKTRWLQKTIAELEERGVVVHGVIAPGTWIEHVDGDGSVSYEKTGIENELLPQHERIPFARRADLAADQIDRQACTQSQRAQLAWAIDDDAIRRVNEHLDTILAHGEHGAGSPDDVDPNGLLVIDELGRLELLRGEGLTSAMRLVDRGATPAIPHALVIVREQLLDDARARFADAPWNGMRPLSPDDAAKAEIFAAYPMNARS